MCAAWYIWSGSTEPPCGEGTAPFCLAPWCVPCLASNETLQELCRKESLICKCLGITRKNLNNYEVEYICDHKIEKGNEYFLVKWKGWPESHNTWEPKQNLKCSTLLKQFYSDLYKYLSELNPGVCFAYSEHRQIKIKPGRPIYECNSRCKCGPDCPNRVVQKGPPYSLCIFRTHNGRGWGVKTLQKIKKHSFVMEYVGEVITTEEAERRGQQYDSTGITYLFDLDYESDEFTVDAARYGNVSHFVNHSCDPNLQVYNVFIDNLDVRLPRIALFSTRQIKAGEELTFDYQMKGSGDLSTDSIEMSPAKKRVRTACRCGAAICRGYL